MERQKFKYKFIKDLGFDEEIKEGDKVFFDIYGFHYSIITKDLTETIYLQWQKETQFCTLVRTDKEYNILKKREIQSDEELLAIIDFFTN